MKLIFSYQPAKFPIPQSFESNFTKVGIRYPQTIDTYDITLQYLVFKIAHFVEINGYYKPAKFHSPGLSGSNFKRSGGKHPPRLTCSQKAQSL